MLQSDKTNQDHAQAKWATLAMLATFLLVAALVSFIYIQYVRRREWVEQQVKKKTTELQENQSFLELMFSSIPDLVFVKDKNYRLIKVNPAFSSLFPEAILDTAVGTNTIEYSRNFESDESHKYDQEAFTTGHSENLETVTLTNGKELTLLINKTRFEDSNGSSYILSIAKDVTAREEHIRQLEQSNKELDEFSYIASHDLKEPLRGIHGHAALFKSDFSDVLDDEGNSRLNRIMALTEQLDKLVSDLLYYSRMGRTPLSLQETDLDALIQDIIATIPTTEDALPGISIDITIANKLPVVKCDNTLIGDLFRHLITNGVKFNDSNQIIIEVGHFEQSESGKTNTVYYVKDNGIGIKGNYHGEIFGIFKRLHKKTAYGGGTGSGLSFVKKIVERHHGKIWLKSGERQGSTFYFTLPLDEE